VRGEGVEQVPAWPARATLGESLERPLVIAVGALDLARELLLTGARSALASCSWVVGADILDERRETLGDPGAASWSHSTGVSDSVTGAPPSSTSSSGR